MTPIITLLTDFGTADGYVGEIKGVLLSEAPGAIIVDISHDITPHDVEMARLTIARYWRRYPHGSVHVAVVDPGVGSTRAALAVLSEGRFLVGPDNGVLSPALLAPRARAIALPVPDGASTTFHGRDVFAPAAAQLARGTPFDQLGAEVHDPVIRRTPEPIRGATGDLQGEVIAIDRFGNAITNISAMYSGVVHVNGMEMPVRRAYAELELGQAGAITGSSGLIEIAIREGRAADQLRLVRGARVLLRS